MPPRLRRVGFVFQNYALFPHLTIYENIAYGIQHLSRQAQTERVTQLLEIMNIPDLGKRFPRHLSGGQQQRVALARAIASEPEILLLDEPFSALDVQVRQRLQMELLAIQKFYKGNILMVTHNLAEGYKLASKIAVYDKGRVIQCDSKAKIINSPANLTVARLTGVRNLFQGSITRIEGFNLWVSIPELKGIFRVELKKALALQVDQRVTVGIRPEFVHLSDNQVENTIQCQVANLVDGITTVDCYFKVLGVVESRHWLEAIPTRYDAERIAPGQVCYVHLHSDNLSIMPD
jgi:molybdate transport system ATP-binding protein